MKFVAFRSPAFLPSLRALLILSLAVAWSVCTEQSLRADILYAWGYNARGQLGDGTTTTRLSPVPVSGLGNDVVAIAGGDNHSLVVLADGTARAWGWNAFGQLGDGTTMQRTTPVSVSGLSNVVAIAGGATHSLAALADGTVRAWGRNAFGQLGDASFTQRTTPVSVWGLSNVVAIAGGGDHSLAVRSDGAGLGLERQWPTRRRFEHHSQYTGQRHRFVERSGHRRRIRSFIGLARRRHRVGLG